MVPFWKIYGAIDWKHKIEWGESCHVPLEDIYLPFSSILEMHVLEMEAHYTIFPPLRHISQPWAEFPSWEFSFAGRKLMCLIYLVLFFVLVEIGTHNFKSHWKNKPFIFQKVFIWTREIIFLHNIYQYV